MLPIQNTYMKLSWLDFKHKLHIVYPKKYAHGFVVLCFVVVMQSFIMNSHEVFIHIHQGCFAGTGAIVRLPQCQWSKPDGYGKISLYNHHKAQQSKNCVHISWDILYMHISHTCTGGHKSTVKYNIGICWSHGILICLRIAVLCLKLVIVSLRFKNVYLLN